MAFASPSEDAEPVILSLDALIRKSASEGRVQMMGTLVPEASNAIRQTRRFGPAETISYQGFRPQAVESTAATEMANIRAPFHIFVEGRSAEPSTTELADAVQVRGFLVKDGLPSHARKALRSKGIALANPHYVLRQTSDRSAWLAAMGIALFASAISGLCGVVMLIRGSLKSQR